MSAPAITALLAEIEAGLEGVTDGQWSACVGVMVDIDAIDATALDGEAGDG